ncbi:MAG: hypothetical protein AAF726_02075 [Planctomycetota bacterium]
MNDDERELRIRDVRTRIRGGSPGVAPAGELDADELVAALTDGAVSLDDADEEALGTALQAHGRDFVVAAVAEGASLHPSGESASESPGNVIDARGRFGRFAGAVALLAAAVLAVVALRTGDARTDAVELVETASVELDLQPSGQWTPGAASFEPAWESSSRGGSRLDPDLRRATAVVRAGEAFGAAAVVGDDGWLVTASDLVADAVEDAAWRGEIATVDVELVDVDARGRATPLGERRPATVMRHEPLLGLSLLRVEDVDRPLVGALVPAAALDGSDEVVLVPPPEMTGEIALRGGIGESATLARGRRGWVLTDVDFTPERIGAAVAGLTEDGERRLLGIALGEVGGELAFAGPEAIAALVGERPPEPERFPVDPWAIAPDVDWRADASTNVLLRRSEQRGTSATLTASFERESSPASEAEGRFGPGDGSWDAFVLRGDRERRFAIGIREDGTDPTRVWTRDGDRSLLYTLGADARWSVEEADELMVGERHRALLEAALGAGDR